MTLQLTRVPKLKPLERQALLAAMGSPTRTLHRLRGGYVAIDAEVTTSGQATIHAFTGRVMNMLWRRGLVVFDELECPSQATLTRMGIATAQAIADSAPPAKRASNA